MDSLLSFFKEVITLQRLYTYAVNLLGIILIIIIAKLVLKYGNKLIDHLLIKSDVNNLSTRRSKTLQMLLKSVIRYTIYFFAVMIILSILNIPITSILAGAGIVGVALGFGAQTLVEDVINGFFILFEDQFGVGDYVETAGVEGVVEQIGLRTTYIKTFGGEEHIIPNGQIRQVSNYCAGSIRVLVDVGVTYNASGDRVIEVLEEMCEKISQEKKDVIKEGPTVLGVQELGDSSVSYRLWTRVKPMSQWQMARYLKKRSKETLEEAGISIPYPHRVIINNE